MSPKSDKTDPQIKARVKQKTLDEINEYRHARKLESRAEAIVELIQLGLDSAHGRSSGDDGAGDMPANGNSSVPESEDRSEISPDSPLSKEAGRAN